MKACDREWISSPKRVPVIVPSVPEKVVPEKGHDPGMKVLSI
jgi:hypothetical protein